MTNPSECEDIAAAIRGQTILSELIKTVEARPNAIALRWLAGETWKQWNWRQYAEQAARFANGLRLLGFRRGDRAVLLMRNVPQFYVADMGVLLAGGTPSSIFEASSPEQMRYIAHHLEATVAIIEDAGCAMRMLESPGSLPALRHVVVLENGDGVPTIDGALRYEELLRADPIDVDAAAAATCPDDLLTVVYTSGTTGPPKGVMISHRNACWWVESIFRAFGSDYSATGKRQLSYLPMAAMAERLATHYLHLARGTEVTTCPDAQRLDFYLRQVRPQIFLGVPRVWEKLHSGIRTMLAADPLKEAAFRHALEVGHELAMVHAAGTPVSASLNAAWERAQAQGLRQIRELIGLDACEIALSGTAPLSVEVVDFFLSLGVPLSETYGLSESTAVTMELVRRRPGTVGRPIPGCDIRLLPDNEIILRSGNLFQGYFKAPAKTAEAIDPDGWFHTGDIGLFDEAGYLRIVDRKKELIITPDGKNLSPANIEAALKVACPLVGQACVFGDRRPYLVALLVLEPKTALAWAKARAIEVTDLSLLAKHPQIRTEVERGVAEANERFSEPEHVCRFVILGEEWLPGSDELTPTMKLRRQIIWKKHATEIEQLYSDSLPRLT